MAREHPPSMDLFVDDFIAGTQYMTHEEVGAYLRLLLFQWGNRSVNVRFLERTLSELSEESKEVLQEKFQVLENGEWVNQRVEDEYAKAKKRRDSRIKNGQKGGRPCKTETKPTGSSSVKLKKPNGKVEVGSRKINKDKKCLSIPDALSCDIPQQLDTAEFRDAWAQWVSYKQTQSHAWKEIRGPKSQLTRLTKHDVNAVVAGIYEAISREWEGIFPERVTGIPSKNKEFSF